MRRMNKKKKRKRKKNKTVGDRGFFIQHFVNMYILCLLLLLQLFLSANYCLKQAPRDGAQWDANRRRVERRWSNKVHVNARQSSALFVSNDKNYAKLGAVHARRATEAAAPRATAAASLRLRRRAWLDDSSDDNDVANDQFDALQHLTHENGKSSH